MSTMRATIDEYLTLRRGLGFKLIQEGRWLGQFASFLERRRSPHITTQLALEWATQPAHAHPSRLARRLSVVRGFASYQAARDPHAEVPPVGLLANRITRKPPYIYSDREIGILLAAAARLPSTTGLRAQTYATLLGLLAVAGLRISEAVGLERADVDLVEGSLHVRRTKFGKSRLVPVHASTRQALADYVDFRDRIWRRPITARFFVGEHGGQLTVNIVEKTFVRVSKQVGLRGPGDSHGPRLHDLRHRFAVRVLLDWYRAGADVEHRLPMLSTYLGHAHVTDTYWYLSAVPELMAFVIARLESRPRGRAR